MKEKDKSFKAFLKMIINSIEARYFGEMILWITLGLLISTIIFPSMWNKTDPDLRGFWIMIPISIWAVLRGSYILWKSDD